MDGRRNHLRRIRVRDASGVRWSVRARRLRHGDGSGPLVGPEQESLRRRLTGLVGPRPVVLLDPLRGMPEAWRLPADSADVALHATWAELRDRPHLPNDVWIVAHLLRLAGDAVRRLRTPWSDTWQLEALASGRIRRWARWEVVGVEATAQAATTVAAALAEGDVPEPGGAVLVEVVDQRPPVLQRRSAGLGRASRAG